MAAPLVQRGEWRYRPPGRAPPRPRRARELSTTAPFAPASICVKGHSGAGSAAAASEQEVGQRDRPGGAGERHRRGPHPLPATDLRRRPVPEIGQRGHLEDALDHAGDDDQPPIALAEIAPPPSACHASLWHPGAETDDDAASRTRRHPMSLAAASTTDRALRQIEERVLWLATAIVDHANRVRPNPTGLKVGGHQ